MAEENVNDERRGTGRKKLIVGVDVQGSDAEGAANTRDIGVGGLYLTTGADLIAGQPITMTFGLASGQLTLDGTVVYTDPGKGAGVRFRDAAKEDIESLLGA